MAVNSPIGEDKLDPNPLPPEKVEEYRELYTRGWEKHAYRELSKEQKLEIAKQVSEEADRVLKQARINAHQRVIDKLQAMKKKDASIREKIAEHQIKKEELLRAYQMETRGDPATQEKGESQGDKVKDISAGLSKEAEQKI